MIPSPFLLLPCLQLSASQQSWDLGELEGSRQDNYPSFVAEKSDSTQLGLFGIFFPFFSFPLPFIFLLFFLYSFLPFLTLPFPIFFSLSLFFPFFSWLGMCAKEKGRRSGVTSGIPWGSGPLCELRDVGIIPCEHYK